jgi:hypothetical protein
MKRQSKSPSSGKNQSLGSTKSFDKMLSEYGTPEAKAELLKNG